MDFFFCVFPPNQQSNVYSTKWQLFDRTTVCLITVWCQFDNIWFQIIVPSTDTYTVQYQLVFFIVYLWNSCCLVVYNAYMVVDQIWHIFTLAAGLDQ